MIELRKDIVKATRRHGFNPIVGDIFLKQEQWFSWFRGNVNGFHTFTRKINGVEKKFQRTTMNMPKKLCEDYHSLLWNENCSIKISDEQAQEAFERVLHANQFETQFGGLLETAFGMGSGYMIQYIDDMGKTNIDFIQFDRAIPLAFNNGETTAIVTYERRKVADANGNTRYITHLTYHYLEDDNYNVKHETYISEEETKLGYRNNKYLAYIFDDESITEEYTIRFDTSEPFFQCIRPNIKNHFDNHSPHGVSIYASMIDYFRTVDVLFDMMETEAQNNRTRIIVDSKLLKTKFETTDDGQAEYVNYFDESDTVFAALPFGGENDEPIYHTQGQFRYEQLKIGIDKMLQLIGFRASLGKNFYSFQENEVYQNEKTVVTSNSDTYRAKKKHEIILREALTRLARSVLRLETLTGNWRGDVDDLEIDVVFDDSLAIDDEAIEEKYQSLAERGYIPKWMLVERVLKVSPEEAKAMVAEAESAEAERNQSYLMDYEE